MRITILGSGGSNGVPEIGCNCFVCKAGGKNIRSRASILVESNDTRVLIDTSPDLRTQAIKYNIKPLDAVLFTHSHSDHVAGMHDLKLLCKNKRIPAYMDEFTYSKLSVQFEYIMHEIPNSIYSPIMEPKIIPSYHSFTVGDINIQSFAQCHKDMKVLGFRFGNIAYSTDLSVIPEESFQYLENLDVWIVDCLRYSWAPTHLFFERTMMYIEKFKPKKAILTHMCHNIEYEEVKSILPAHIEPAFDGMQI